MKVVELDEKSQYINDVKRIYLSSFPENERIDFKEIVNKTFPNSKLLGFIDNDTLLGFSFISQRGSFVYIIYLAIDANFRNRGYGTQALNEISNRHKNKTKVLCAEKPNSQEDIQSRRIRLYERNGFEMADFQFEWIGQDYCVMYNGDFNKQEFLEFLLICFPTCKNFREIKKEV